MPYAADTDVAVSRSQQQIEAMLKQRGCEGYASAWSSQGNRIEFVWKGMRIRFTLPAVDAEKYKFDAQGRARKDAYWRNAIEQADRVRWRGLFLVIKAKLEAVEAGISVFEEEFMAFIVDPMSDRTIGDVLLPRIQAGTQLLLTEGKRG